MTPESLHLRQASPPEINPDKWEINKLEPLLELTQKIFNIQSHSFPEIIIDRHNQHPMQVKQRIITNQHTLLNQPLNQEYLSLCYPHPEKIAEAAGYNLRYQSSYFPMAIATYNRDLEISMLKLQGASIKHPTTWTSYTYLCCFDKYKDVGRNICHSLAVGKLPSNFIFDLVARTSKKPTGRLDINTKNLDSWWLKNDLLTVLGCEFVINDKQQKVISEGTATCITQSIMTH